MLTNLELVVFEHFQQVGFLHLQPFERLLLLHYPLHNIVQRFEVVVGNLSSRKYVEHETVF